MTRSLVILLPVLFLPVFQACESEVEVSPLRQVVIGMGANEMGQLANGTTVPAKYAVAVSLGLKEMRDIDIADDHVMALGWNGTVVTWAYTFSWPPYPEQAADTIFFPAKKHELPSIKKICANSSSSMALSEHGNVWVWRKSSYNTDPGEVGIYPIKKEGISNAVDISCGSDHWVTLSRAGYVFAWGDNHWGQLGAGDIAFDNDPRPVRKLRDIVSIASGNQHSIALDSTGRIYTWGRGSSGQLGYPVTGYSDLPSHVPLETGVSEIFAGAEQTFVVDSLGRLWAWGRNDLYQLGLGHNDPVTQPTVVSHISNVTDLDTGVANTIATTSRGIFYQWGYCHFASGQWTTGKHIYTEPSKFLPFAGTQKVANGRDFYLAIREVIFTDGEIPVDIANWPD